MEGLGEEHIRFLQVVGRERKSCGTDVMAVALEVLGKWARALAVVPEQRYMSRHV